MPRKRLASRNTHPRSDRDIQRISRYLDSTYRSIEWQESQAEQRVKLFLAIASGSIAALGLVIKVDASSGFNSTESILFVLLVLLVYGIETLHSLNWMIIEKRQAAAVIQFLTDELASIDPIVGRIQAISREAFQLKESAWHRRVRGSRQEFIYLANCLLSTAIAWNLTQGDQISATCRFSLVAGIFVLAMFLQYFYSKKIRNAIPENWTPKDSPPA